MPLETIMITRHLRFDGLDLNKNIDCEKQLSLIDHLLYAINYQNLCIHCLFIINIQLIFHIHRILINYIFCLLLFTNETRDFTILAKVVTLLEQPRYQSGFQSTIINKHTHTQPFTQAQSSSGRRDENKGKRDLKDSINQAVIRRPYGLLSVGTERLRLGMLEQDTCPSELKTGSFMIVPLEFYGYAPYPLFTSNVVMMTLTRQDMLVKLRR